MILMMVECLTGLNYSNFHPKWKLFHTNYCMSIGITQSGNNSRVIVEWQLELPGHSNPYYPTYISLYYC